MAASTYTVERTAIVNAQAAAVYERLIDFHRWAAWSPWEELDPDMTKTFSGAESGIGSIYEWTGNRKVGEGRMEMTDAKENETVVINLRFLRPFKSENTTTLTLEPEGDGTRVTWTLVAPHTLMTRIMGIFMSMDKMVGKDFAKGLDLLKKDVEQAA